MRTAGYGAALLSPVRSGSAVALLTGSGADVGAGVIARRLRAGAVFRVDLAWPSGTPSPTRSAFVDACRRTALGANGLRVHQGGSASTPVRRSASPALTRKAA